MKVNREIPNIGACIFFVFLFIFWNWIRNCQTVSTHGKCRDCSTSELPGMWPSDTRHENQLLRVHFNLTIDLLFIFHFAGSLAGLIHKCAVWPQIGGALGFVHTACAKKQKRIFPLKLYYFCVFTFAIFSTKITEKNHGKRSLPKSSLPSVNEPLLITMDLHNPSAPC